MTKRRDLTQMEEKLTEPEVRVWIHPREGGDDYYKTFEGKNWKEAVAKAEEFMDETEKRTEEQPLIAYQGYEYTVDRFRREVPKRQSRSSSIIDWNSILGR